MRLIFIAVLALGLTACGEDVNFDANSQTAGPVQGQGEGGVELERERFTKFQIPEIKINDDAAFTNSANVDLTLASEQTREMYITNDATCTSGGSWQAYSDKADWTLANLNSEAKVYAKFRYINDVESDCVSDAIVHDSQPPEINFTQVPELQSYNTMTVIQYTATDAGSGVASHNCKLDNADIGCEMLGLIDLKNLSLGTHTIEVTATDKALNIAMESYSWSIVDEAPRCLDNKDEFMQPVVEVTNTLDILFVVDTSGSLDAERDAVANGIDQLINQLPVGTDFRLAMLAAHSDSSQYGGLLYQKGNEPVVLSSTMDAGDLKADLASKLSGTPQDDPSDGGEAGLFAVHYLLSGENGDNLQNAKDQGFFRKGAALAVIFITDENDICAPLADDVIPVAGNDTKSELPAYENLCVDPVVNDQTVLAQLQNLQGDDPLLVAGIVYDNFDTAPKSGENGLAYGILEIVAANKGITVDMANPDDIADGLKAIGEMTKMKLQLMTSFELEKTPLAGETITVKVDGNEVPFTKNEGNRIEIALEDAGMAESKITIDYCYEETMSSVGTTAAP